MTCDQGLPLYKSSRYYREYLACFFPPFLPFLKLTYHLRASAIYSLSQDPGEAWKLYLGSLTSACGMEHLKDGTHIGAAFPGAVTSGSVWRRVASR